MGNTVQIGMPFSANNMYAPIGRGQLVKTKKYKDWIEKNVPILRAGLKPPSKFPIAVDILIMGGRGWTNQNDTDNAVKPIIDALVRAEVIPDDQSRYIEHITVRFLHGIGRSTEAITVISYEEPAEVIETMESIYPKPSPS